MRRLVLSVLCLSFFLFACERYDDPSVVKTTVEETGKRFEEAMNKGDINGIMAMYWKSPDLVVMNPLATYKGYDSVRASWEMFFQVNEGVRFGLTETHVEVHNDRAYGWGMYDIAFTPKGGVEVSLPGRYTGVWAKKDGKWVVIMEHASSPIPPPQPPAPEPEKKPRRR